MASTDPATADKLQQLREKQKQIRESAKVFKSPFFTLFYFVTKVVPQKLGQLFTLLLSHKITLLFFVFVIATYTALYIIENPLQERVHALYEFLKICVWWVVLGVLSSIGLGTGLHTFVLYLGPFIASTTLAVTECNTLQIERYGENRFICPTTTDPSEEHPTIFKIWTLVALEAFLWGAGTAIGELPPYFVARAAKLAGARVQELEEEQAAIQQDTSFFGKVKQFVLSRLSNIGFIGIMLFASIPNPLFDLAGLTCGHMLVPFATFFLATLMGKAVIKANLQAFFVITVFSKEHLVAAIDFIERWFPFLRGRAVAMFDQVRQQYHRRPGEEIAAPQKNPLFLLWDVFLALMIGYFIISIIDSSVQEHLANAHEEEYKAASQNLSKASKESSTDSPKRRKDTKKVK